MTKIGIGHKDKKTYFRNSILRINISKDIPTKMSVFSKLTDILSLKRNTTITIMLTNTIALMGNGSGRRRYTNYRYTLLTKEQNTTLVKIMYAVFIHEKTTANQLTQKDFQNVNVKDTVTQWRAATDFLPWYNFSDTKKHPIYEETILKTL